MEDSGYRSYQDPRLQPPDEPERESCGSCAYYREANQTQDANGFVHCVGVCIFEVLQADTFKDLATTELVEADPAAEACRDYKEKE